ncbi:uncharacterized protein [Solanum lycopersicum]|uniref:uncharacterized protein n=1 Tax=Solanum lycopersicum TaxID=4081 RepID=UPI0037484A7A
MTIDRLMVHAQQVEEARSKRKSRDAEGERSFDSGSSKNRLEIQDKPRFKNWVSNQVPNKFPKANDDRVSNTKPKKGNGTASPTKKSTCEKCGKKHYGDCLKGRIIVLVVVKVGTRLGRNVRGQDKGSGQVQASGSNEAPKKNRFYALCSNSEQETSPDVVIDMLKVLSIDV